MYIPICANDSNLLHVATYTMRTKDHFDDVRRLKRPYQDDLGWWHLPYSNEEFGTCPLCDCGVMMNRDDLMKHFGNHRGREGWGKGFLRSKDGYTKRRKR